MRMIVNGPRPTSIPPSPENSTSAPDAVESMNANGFSSLLFLILASRQPALGAVPSEPGANSDSTPLAAADGPAFAKCITGNGAASNAASGIRGEDENASYVAKSQSASPALVDPMTATAPAEIVAPEFLTEADSPRRAVLAQPTSARFTLDPATGKTDIVSGQTGMARFFQAPEDHSIDMLSKPTQKPSRVPDAGTAQTESAPGQTVVPGLVVGPDGQSRSGLSEPMSAKRGLDQSVLPGFPPADDDVRKIISPATAGHDRSEANAVQPTRVGAEINEQTDATIVIAWTEPALREVSHNTSVPTIGKSAAVNRKATQAGGIPQEPTGEEVESFDGSPEKILERAEPPPLKPVAEGRIGLLQSRAKASELSVSAPDDLDSEPMVEPKSRFEKKAIPESAEGEMRSFSPDPKEREVSQAGRSLAQSLNESGNPMLKPTLPRDGAGPEADAPTSTWHPTIERVAGEIVGHIQINKREAILHLDPPELGKIKIDLHLNGDKLQAHIFAEAHEAQSLIENHMQELRQALQANNFDLVDVRVQGGWHQAMGDAMHGFPQQQQQQAAGQQERTWASGNGPEAEVVEPQSNHGSTSAPGRVSMWA